MDLRTICLGLLTLGDRSGYELKKLFEDGSLGSIAGVSFGAIYPALGKLANEGLVSCRAEAQKKRPDKKIYSITPAGRAAFVEALMDPVAEDRFRSTFIFVMYFAHLMPGERLRELLSERIASAEQRIAQLRALEPLSTCPSHRFVIGLGLATYTAELTYLKRQRHSVEAPAKRRLDDLREPCQLSPSLHGQAAGSSS
ncbi:MAG: PadR family transcriptional regulator [Alphaproteobacteria bacterium]|nr:PadR family transcriptional regulator [Alphaproteobacteria bacterium]